MKIFALRAALFAMFGVVVSLRLSAALVSPAAEERKMIDQGARDPRLKGYFTPEGIKAEIIAAAPIVLNPIGLTFGDDGTPYVLERQSSGEKGDSKNPKTIVKVLQYDAVKGNYDRSRVVLEEESPARILLHDGWIYLASGGTLRRVKPAEKGSERSEVVARGFSSSPHAVAGLALGNDGLLYISCGDGDHRIEGSDGSRATVLRSGAVFRCRPDGSRMETFALGLRNPGGVAFDALGNLFLADNDDEKGGCGLLHVAEGCDFGWRLHPDARGDQMDRWRSVRAGERPGTMPPLLRIDRGAAAGLRFYDDTRFPDGYRGRLYFADAFSQRIRTYQLEPHGATFTANDPFDLLRSNDPYFRPRQITVGPDGALYVVDERTEADGRIYRLSWAGTAEKPALPLRSRDSWMRIIRQSDDDLLKTLAGAEFSERSRAQRELVRRGERNRAALVKLLGEGEQPVTGRIAALGVLESFWNEDVQQAFLRVLEYGEEPLRRLAAEGLGRHAPRGDRNVHNGLLKALNDNDVSVRRAAALAMGRIAAPGAADALVNTFAFDDSGDRYLRDGVLRALESLGKPGIDRLLALAESGVGGDTDRVVAAFAALRTRAAYEGLPALLKYPHLKVAQRVQLIRSGCNYLLEPPISFDPLLAYLNTEAAESLEVKRAAVDLLSAGGIARSRKAEDWLLGLPAWAERAVKSARLTIMEEASLRAAVIAAIERMRLTRATPLLADMLKERRSSAERDAILQALHSLGEP